MDNEIKAAIKPIVDEATEKYGDNFRTVLLLLAANMSLTKVIVESLRPETRAELMVRMERNFSTTIAHLMQFSGIKDDGTADALFAYGDRILNITVDQPAE